MFVQMEEELPYYNCDGKLEKAQLSSIERVSLPCDFKGYVSIS